MERRTITGLEWGRAFAAIAVVAWHTQAVGPTAYHGGAPDLHSVAYFNVLLLAVPVFMSISLYLYIRQRGAGRTTLTDRVWRLGYLAVFWTALITLTRGVHHVDLADAPGFVLSGGNSIFYFFVQLLLMTILAEAALALGLARRPRAVLLCLAASLALLLLRSRIAELPGGEHLTLYYGVINFPAYVFAMLGLHMLVERGWRPGPAHLALGLAVYAAVAALEWPVLTSEPFGGILSAYGRPSLVIGAAVLVAAMVTASWPRWPAVLLLAELSLAIYCVHILILEHLGALLPTLSYHHTHDGPTAFLITLGLTLPIAYSLRRREVV